MYERQKHKNVSNVENCTFFCTLPNHDIHNKHLFRKTTRNEDDVEFVKNMQEKYTGLFRQCQCKTECSGRFAITISTSEV